MINRSIGLDEIERDMTDNTPRPEPMSRESVLAVLEAAMYDGSIDEKDAARSAVSALYERCEALERAVERKDGALRTVARRFDSINGLVAAGLREAVIFTGTEPSDAEGGG